MLGLENTTVENWVSSSRETRGRGERITKAHKEENYNMVAQTLF